MRVSPGGNEPREGVDGQSRPVLIATESVFLFMPKTPENTETAMQYSKFVIIAYICYKKVKNRKVKFSLCDIY